MIENEVFENLLVHIYNRYGYDFTQYSKASLQRRVNAFCTKAQIQNYDDLLLRLSDHHYFTYFIEEITVNVTEMFRDVAFYKMLKEKVQNETYKPKIAERKYSEPNLKAKFCARKLLKENNRKEV